MHPQRPLQSTIKERGFGLVELIVVVAILGVLVVVAIPVFGAIQTKARQNTLVAAAENAASEIAVALTDKPGDRQTALTAVDRLNASQKDFAYTLAPQGTTSTNVGLKLPGTTTTRTTTVRPAPNVSTDTVYVYATDSKRNWAGAGTNGERLLISPFV